MYHYGITIREYREKANMTQAQLADRWPKSERFGGGEGVNWKYIQDIEHGRKHIDNNQTLRKVCDILSIPYYKVGLSEYDPFTQTMLPGYGTSMYDETLDTVEDLVRQLWSLRCAARITEADKGVRRLLRELHRRCTVMGSWHALSQVNKVLASLDRDGYGDVQSVREFQEEMREETKK